MELMFGYKHSEVGLIPEDWDVLPLGKLVRSVEYGSAAKSDVKGAVPVLRMGNLQAGKIDWSDLVYTDDIDEINKYMLQQGDVLFNRTNTIELVGKTSIYEGGCPAIFAGYLIRINVASDLLDSRFLNYILNTEFSRKYSAKVLSVAVGQANINGQKLKTYPIPLPPTKTEQENIAQALSDTDELLVALEQMIAKKRDLKQAAMQQLLTGQTRLPGFSGEWVEKRLEELCAMKSGEGITAKNIDTYSEYPCYGGNGLRGFTTRFTHDGKYCLIGRVGALCGNLVNVSGKFFASEHAIVVTALDGVDISWLTLALGTLALNRRSESSAQPVLTVSKLRPLKLLAPPTEEEQSAIAQVLAEMDAEISSFKVRRDKTRNIKQAMMQELLTGKTRLIAREECHV
ncbi:restriction endonuclease subunit S [Serratia marcescens]|nr:restriction endonuclease subunit S [Serratia marcescens]ELI8846700.1 restriction endonuclease subunit S [Serratia marcescens]